MVDYYTFFLLQNLEEFTPFFAMGNFTSQGK